MGGGKKKKEMGDKKVWGKTKPELFD